MPTRTVEHKMVLEALNTHYWVSYVHIIDQLKSKISPARAKRAFLKDNPDLYHFNDEDQIKIGTSILFWNVADVAVRFGDIEIHHQITTSADRVKVVWVRPTKLSASYVDSLVQSSRTLPVLPSNVINVDSFSYPNLVSVLPGKNNDVDMTLNYSINDKSSLHSFKMHLSAPAALKLADQLQMHALAINDFGGHDIDDPCPS